MNEPVAMSPGAVPVSEMIELFLALAVSSMRTGTVQEPPGARIGTCCLSGLMKIPAGAFTRSAPGPLAVAPVFVSLILTVFDLPTFSFTGLDLAIESTGGAGDVD